MTEMIDKPSFLYDDDTKIIGKLFEISSNQTDLTNVITWEPKKQK